MREVDFQNSVVASLRQEGAMVLKFHDEATAGIPDLFVGSAPLGFWLELKLKKAPLRPTTPLRPGLTPVQFATLSRLHRNPIPAGVLVAVTDPLRWLVVPAPRLKFILEETPWSELPWQTGKVTLKGLRDGWMRTADFCLSRLPDDVPGEV